MPGKVFGERRHAIALGGMMPAGQEGDAAFARQMNGLLRNFTGNKGVNAERDRLLEIALGAPCAPAEAAHRAPGIADQHGRARQLGGELVAQLCRSRRLTDTPQPSDVLLAKTPIGQPAEAGGELGVVAQFGVGVKRQVVGQEADVVRQQCLEALTTDAP